MIKSVIFDLDGTLMDTSEGIFSSVKKTVEHFGYRKLTQSELESFIGPPIGKSMIRHFGISDEETKDAIDFYRSKYSMDNKFGSEADLYKAKVYDGIEELVLALKDMGLKVGVATYKPEYMAQKLLEAKDLSKLFDVIHGVDIEGKLTKADVIEMSIKELGYNPKETVMVGDSDNDAIGAESSGTLFIGVTYGFGFKTSEDLSIFPNIGACPTAKDILKIIRYYNSKF